MNFNEQDDLKYKSSQHTFWRRYQNKTSRKKNRTELKNISTREHEFEYLGCSIKCNSYGCYKIQDELRNKVIYFGELDDDSESRNVVDYYFENLDLYGG